MAKPKHFKRLAKRYPEVLDSVERLGEAAKRAGPLDPKVCELVQLAVAAAARSEGAVHSHARRAAAAGATPDEIPSRDSPNDEHDRIPGHVGGFELGRRRRQVAAASGA
jgi:AhpD family alkylhydroperoxidase